MRDTIDTRIQLIRWKDIVKTADSSLRKRLLMSFLTNEDMLYIDFGDNTFDVESANRKAETVYDGVKHLEQTVTDEEMKRLVLPSQDCTF